MVAMAMAATAMAMDTAMERGKQRLPLLLSLAMDTMADTAMVATEVMAMVVMVTTASMARGLLMLTPTTATEDMVDTVRDTAMDMVMALDTATARDLPMPTMATVDMVMATAMATVMDTDTTDKKEGVVMMPR